MEKVRIELMKDLSEVVPYEREGVRLYICEGNLFAHPGLRAPCHWHDDLECIHILDGSMGYSVNGQEIVLHAGDSLVVNARKFHFGHDCGGQDCRYLCILFHPSLLTGNGTLLKQEVMPPLPESPYTDLELQKDMVSYIYQNYRKKLTLAKIASSGRVSRSKCCQMFRHYLQQSPIDFLNDYRLRVSCNLLRNTELRITEVALSCGFNHLNYFSKRFVERFGYTPKEYRKRW